MKAFVRKYAKFITGTLTGFDRLIFRGRIRSWDFDHGPEIFLSAAKVLFKDFGAFAEKTTNKLVADALGQARKLARPTPYLNSPKISKLDTALQIAQKDRISQGLICVIRCNEMAPSWKVVANRETQKLEIRSLPRPCLHLYQYSIHPLFGLMHARIQTFFPFAIQIWLNGREWAARSMDRKGLGYVRRENCFTWLEDVKATQRIMDRQLNPRWPFHLNRIASQLLPNARDLFAPYGPAYYWTVAQSEYPTDVMFRSTEDLAAIYPDIANHAITHFQSRDAMRFLGRRVPATGHVHKSFQGQVVTELKHRPEGICIRHRVNKNSIKLYDKQGSVLRAEPTINDPKDLGIKVFRAPQGKPKAQKKWLPLRKGVADLKRRAVVSKNAGMRYLESLAAADTGVLLRTAAEPVCKRTTWKNKPVRALNPWAPQDAHLLKTLLNGAFTLSDFRNRDIQHALFEQPAQSAKEKRRRSAQVSRKLRMLRAHGLIAKVPHTHRYRLLPKGRETINALMVAREARVDQLNRLAS